MKCGMTEISIYNEMTLFSVSKKTFVILFTEKLKQF